MSAWGMPSSRMPLPVRPMLATLGDLPMSGSWAYEFKWDGARAIVRVDAEGGVAVASRNDRDVTATYPELHQLGSLASGRRLTVDGEIVALDRSGVPSFSLLQRRMHVVRPSPTLVSRVPVRLYVFDVVYLDDRLTTTLRYVQRRKLLAGLHLADTAVATPQWWDGGAGEEVMTAAASLGMEGVIAKRMDSVYEPGVRSRSWIKAPFNRTVEVVIGGWTPGSGRRANSIGSLLLGMYDENGRLRYVGHVGTGFTQHMLAELYRLLAPLSVDASPFGEPVPREHARDARWVTPSLVGDVAYRAVTPDSRLRHPSWRGLRPDRQPEEVIIGTLCP